MLIREFFSAEANAPFIWALVLLCVLSILVVLGSVFGAFAGPEADLDLEADAAEGPLEFLGASSMPLSVYVTLFCGSFFVAGYCLQMAAYQMRGAFLPGWIALAAATGIALGTGRLAGKLAKRANLKVETEVISAESLVTRIAVIAEGTARKGLPAQAKLTDEHGATHYVLVEPLRGGDEFTRGQEVVLLERQGPKYLVMGATLEDLNSLSENQ